MSQDSVLKYIEKHPGLNAEQIAKGLKLSRTPVQNSLKILRMYGDISFVVKFDGRYSRKFYYSKMNRNI